MSYVVKKGDEYYLESRRSHWYSAPRAIWTTSQREAKREDYPTVAAVTAELHGGRVVRLVPKRGGK